MFGSTVTISLDVLRQFNARAQARPKKWLILDGDANGAGIVPYNYRRGDFYNAVQWAVGLELFAADRYLLVFIASCLAILPLAGWLGWATERLAARLRREGPFAVLWTGMADHRPQ